MTAAAKRTAKRASAGGLLAVCLLCALAAVVGLWGSGLIAPASGVAPAPTFVQSTAAHSASATTLPLTPPAVVTEGDRLVVEAGVWNSGGATASSVTDSAGNAYIELLHFKATDGTEMSVWTAPITAGGGTQPTIKVNATSGADVGAIALEYSGLSSVADASVLDRSATASGTTASAGTVSPGATAATTAASELALGLYADSGFANKLGGDAAFTVRSNLSPQSDMELLAQDAVLGEGATPNPSFSTGAKTTWLAATVVLRAGSPGAPTVPGAPSGVAASAGNGGANVSWTAPGNGGSAITKYTITPYIGAAPQTSTVLNGSPPATSKTIEGLTNGTTYTFTVTATNAVGTGIASPHSNTATPGAKPEGEFGPLMSWPEVALHQFLLTNGRVVGLDGWQEPQPSYEWNPATEAFIAATPPNSIFCGGEAQLPNGEVMMVGGSGILSKGENGIVGTAAYNPATGKWSSLANMKFPRWYPAVTELSDGRYVAISGNSTNATTWADTPEVYDPATNKWSSLTKVSTPQVHEEEYPFAYLIPNGNVFTIGTSEDNSFQLNVGAQTWTPTGGASGILNGSSVMYRPGKILYSGGAPSIPTTTSASASAATIDLTAATPKWGPTEAMKHPRIFHTLTMLADGTVLAVGGNTTSDQQVITSGVLPTEIWDPATAKWTAAAPISAARNYHSTAILMPDGKVLVAGGGHPTGLADAGQYSAQTYSPPYLFKGARPTITSATTASAYNTSITVKTPDAASIASVNLVSLGADTHQSDMAQHFVPLSFTAAAGSLSVQTPTNSSLAPYGNYMLFIVNKEGVPSISAPLNLSSSPQPPAAPTNVTATAGVAGATVSWTAPEAGTSPIASYTVTPYVGATAQTPTVLNGSPPTTSTTIEGLSNGTEYTFTVTAASGAGSGPPSAHSNAVTPAATAPPGAPTAVSATPGNGAASLSWSAPAANGSPITKYTIVPYIGATAQPATTVTGSPPATGATVEGLTNGTTYTFTVTAANANGPGPVSAPSNAVTPTGSAFPAIVQSGSAHASSVSALPVTLPSPLVKGNRLIVEVGVAHAATASVIDATGDTFTRLLSFKGKDGTTMSVWSAPVTSGAGATPTITATATASASIGVAALEYSGLSSAGGKKIVDRAVHAKGIAKAAGTLTTNPTKPTRGANELLLGFYADGGYADAVTPKMGFNARIDVSPTSDVELLVEDALTGAPGATPAVSVQTGGPTTWLLAGLTLYAAPAGAAPAAPNRAPAHVFAAPSAAGASLAWTPSPNNGSPITNYVITPYAGSHAMPSTTVSGTTAQIGGLRNGTAYRFRIRPRNALGLGPASRPTRAVRPQAGLLPAPWCAPLLGPLSWVATRG